MMKKVHTFIELVFLGLCSTLLLCLGNAQSNNANAPLQYFGGTGHDAYSGWLNDNNNSYSNSVFLPSPEGNDHGVAIHWRLDDRNIYLAVAARATGWVAFGISENGGMKGADMVYMEASPIPTLTDAHVLDKIMSGPIHDECQSWTMVNAQTNDGFLIFEAVRLLNTFDPQDRPIFNDGSLDVTPSRIIGAWGDTSKISYHGPESRVRSAIRFYGSGIVEENIDAETETNKNAVEDLEYDGFVEIRANDYPIKAVDTEYADFCATFEDLVAQGLPEDDEVHVVAMEPILNQDTAKHVHHFSVHTLENAFAGRCVEVGAPNIIYVWTPGGLPLILPDNVGLPFGKGVFDSVNLVIHYNLGEEGVLDSSGVRFYYTSKKRQHDMGVLVVGDPTLNLIGSSIGDGLTKHTLDCPSSCSESAIGGQASELTVIRESLHMHASGARMVNRQLRDGEIIRSGSVDYFDFDMQGTFDVQQRPFTIRPGDSFETTCYYDNGKNSENKFGFSSQQEMCDAFLYYYPKVQLSDNLPYMCGFRYSPQCDSDYERVTLEDDTELGREFGAPAEFCSLPTVELNGIIVQTGYFNAGNNGDGPFPLGLCEGDCDDDSECQEGLICFQRDDQEAVPGCAGDGAPRNDYCYRPITEEPSNLASSKPSLAIASSPSTSPVRIDSDPPSTNPVTESSDVPSVTSVYEAPSRLNSSYKPSPLPPSAPHKEMAGIPGQSTATSDAISTTNSIIICWLATVVLFGLV